MTTDLTVSPTDIPGLLVLTLPLHGDSRGWFKENWQREKMVALGLPDFTPVQNNMSYNDEPGVTRGIHAEPWDKLVSVACGRVFAAWVDLRDGESFGRTFTVEIDPGTAVFVPRGVGNSYQALEPGTTYTYLVNDHWSPDARSRYTYLNLDHPGITWPIPLSEATLSDADKAHPRIEDVTPGASPRPVITGAKGQVGRAIQALLPDAILVDRDELDITNPDAVAAFPWRDASVIINAAAWTAVDAAETTGRTANWAVNVTGVANLVAAARAHRLPLIHFSTDYIFDGATQTHTEDESPSPLGVYGAAKAAADSLVATWPRHYILRTSWVIGEGKNFVRTMAGLAAKGITPSVVNDQYGRLTFADDLAAAALHLLTTEAPFGTYNMTADGPTMSWHDVAAAVYSILDAGEVLPTDTATYGAGKEMAARPVHSTLDLTKIKAAGYQPWDGAEALRDYVKGLQ